MKKAYIYLIILVVVIIAAVLIYRHYQNQPQYSTTNNQTVQNSANTPATASPASIVVGPRSGAAYTKAMATYKYRLQFSQCHGTTTTNVGTLTLKQSDNFMLDNRDAVTHTFAFKGQSVVVPGDSFAIVTASVIGSYPITCDGGGAALLQVE